MNTLYGCNKKMPKKLSLFKVGDPVRISRMKGKFEKGYMYETNWSCEIFRISAVIPRNPPVFKVKDYKGEVIDGTFYHQELQLVNEDKNGYYHIEKILKTRKRKGQSEYFVKWQGYPASMNSWVKDLKRL